MHWSQGAFGYFPTYTLGTLTAAHLVAAIKDDLPALPEQIADGHFAPLLEWLRTHIHRHGRILKAPDLLHRATGAALSADPWLRYARDKFGALYDLS